MVADAETLALVGRNKVVYSLGAASKPYVTWPGDCVAHVASYLPLDDLCLGSPRCVDKEWRFHADRSLRLRLDEVKAEIARPDRYPTPEYDSDDTEYDSDDRHHRLEVGSKMPKRYSPARRCANVAELRSAFDDQDYWTKKDRRMCRLVAAVHGVVLGPARVSCPPHFGMFGGRGVTHFFFVERAQLYVESCCTIYAPKPHWHK